jgi:IclR family mhp operon transcriptional activator
MAFRLAECLIPPAGTGIDPAMERSNTLRGLERGLQVIRALQASGTASLQDLHAATQIPKPSLLRILKTLELGGVISRRLADGHYRTRTNIVRMARKGDRHDRIAEAAGPVLDRLCRKISWPSDVLVPAGRHMEIRETSRTHSPFTVHIP